MKRKRRSEKNKESCTTVLIMGDQSSTNLNCSLRVRDKDVEEDLPSLDSEREIEN